MISSKDLIWWLPNSTTMPTISLIHSKELGKPTKACYRKRDERISRLVLGYAQSQIDQYLKNISPNISL
jgi:hypothetical protein